MHPLQKIKSQVSKKYIFFAVVSFLKYLKVHMLSHANKSASIFHQHIVIINLADFSSTNILCVYIFFYLCSHIRKKMCTHGIFEDLFCKFEYVFLAWTIKWQEKGATLAWNFFPNTDEKMCWENHWESGFFTVWFHCWQNRQIEKKTLRWIKNCGRVSPFLKKRWYTVFCIYSDELVETGDGQITMKKEEEKKKEICWCSITTSWDYGKRTLSKPMNTYMDHARVARTCMKSYRRIKKKRERKCSNGTCVYIKIEMIGNGRWLKERRREKKISQKDFFLPSKQIFSFFLLRSPFPK